jgi:hypothetical protein
MKNYLKKVILIATMTSWSLYPLLAANYYVKPGGNDGVDGLSLESAFLTLNKAQQTAADGDTITISGTITAGVVLISSTLTIIGISDATIDVNFASRCLELNGGDITLQNITLTQGFRGSGGNGGAIAVYDAKLTAIGCAFTNNFAGRSSAIDAQNTELYLKNCIFSNNNTASVYNIAGQKLPEQILNDGITVLDHNFETGIYMVKTGNKISKIIIK